MTGTTNTGSLTAHVPTVLLRHLDVAPDELVRTLDATVMFADVSGFTRLSERLARSGKEGAERLTDAINSIFTALLAEAYDNGASLIKFGGDAQLLWFDGEDHAARACTAAVAMRKALRAVVRDQSGSERVVLRMSTGVHSGSFQTFLVGGSHREYLIAGPAASKAVAMEAIAGTGQILVSEATAQQLPSSCLGAAVGPGMLLSRSPMSSAQPRRKLPRAPLEVVARCLSTELRAHLLAAPAAPEHRMATITFLQFGTLDRLIAEQGADVAARQLDELVRIVQDAADHYEVCFLGSDVAVDGGKLLLSAGAPRAVGDDEERMLLTLRQVIESEPRLPIRMGVNRGHVFAGEVGPFYRRTYTLMGDAVNLGARLSAKAPWGSIYATPGVLDRSSTRFELTAVPPFVVKGKSRPVDASEVGRALGAAMSAAGPSLVPLVGRDEELATLRQAVTDARLGRGSLVQITGETGSGKSRLLAEARELGEGMRLMRTVCETYTQTIPYSAWREPLRQLLGLTRDDDEQLVIDRLREHVEAHEPGLEPWLPLLAISLGAEVPSTREVRELSADFRAAKLHETVLEFIAPALAVPTVVEMEHAHLMDEASAALLHALAVRLRDSSWLVLVTRRDTAGGFTGDESPSRRLELAPLSAQAALALAETTPEAHVVPPHLLELAVQRSGGSPEFLLDLLSAAASGSGMLPDSLEAAASARIDALDPGDRALVRRAALLGMRFDPRRLPDVLEPGSPVPDERTWARLEAIFAGEDNGQLRFLRPALCEVAYDGLPFELRRRLHASIARALEHDLGHSADADPAVLSLHFSRAGDHVRAWKYALLGAERATAHFANADAVRLYRLAIDAGRANKAPAAELAAAWEALGEALRQAGERKAANEAYTSARSLFKGSAIDQARLLYRHAVGAERTGGGLAAVRWATRGLRELEGIEGEEPTRWRARLLADLAGFRQRQGRTREAERLCREAIAEAESVAELRALARACYVLDYALVESGRPDEAVYSARALEIYEELSDPEQESAVLNNLGMFAYWRGAWDEAIDFYRRQAACSERSGNPANVAYTDCNVGEILSDQGHFGDATEHLRRARRVWSSTGDAPGVAFANLQVGRIAAREGRTEEGISLLTAAAKELRRFRLDGYADFADSLVAEAEALGGDARRALEIVDPLFESSDRNVPLLQRVRGIALARLGAGDEATVALQASLESAQERNAHYDVAATLDAMALIGGLDDQLASERDAILEQLRIVAMPRPPLLHPDELRDGAGSTPGQVVSAV